MEVFEVVTASDPRTRVPFRVPLGDGECLEFDVPRMQFLPEDVARAMKEKLQALDRFVQQINTQGEPMWELDEKGEPKVDEHGEKVPLMGPPQRTVHERTRGIATTMLAEVVDAPILERLKKLTVGELDQILEHWTKASEAPLNGINTGESSASSNS